MIATELKQVMLDFVNAKSVACEKLLADTPKDNRTEIKALTIQKNMTGNSAAFLQYDFGGRYYEVRENIVFRFKPVDLFLDYYDEFCTLTEENKKLFVTFAYPMGMVMSNFYLPRAKVLETGADAKKIFEAKIIVGTLGEILGEWQRLWNAYGCVKCEVFK